MYVKIKKTVLAVGRMQPDGTINLLGSCFEVSPNKFATAAHVVGFNDIGLCVVNSPNAGYLAYQDTTSNAVSRRLAKLDSFDPIRDVAIISVSNPYVFSLTPAALNETTLLTGSDSVEPGTDAVSFGYPHAPNGRMVLTQQNGVVGAKVLLGRGGTKVKHLILNILTRPGQSGGPVCQSGSSEVCAMIVGAYTPSNEVGFSFGGLDPNAVHQTTHAVSAEYIREILQC